MSKISNNLFLIAQGWKNVVFKSPEVEAMAKKRAAICAENKCGLLRFAAKGLDVTAWCGGCGCPIVSASRAPGKSCPKGLWTQEVKS